MMRYIYSILLSLSLLFVACDSRVDSYPSIDIIAHAGGVAHGFLGTNSREALEHSLLEEYRFVEFDFLFTADSVLVAVHDWESFNKRTGHEHKGDSAPTYKEFKSRLIDEVFTPLSAAEINEVFEQDTTLCLVTDKISSPRVLEGYFPNIKERMVVEAFSYDDYVALQELGYYRVLYSCMASDLYQAVFKHLLFHRLFTGPKIEWITMYSGELDNLFFRIIEALSAFKMAVFTVNDYSEIPHNLLPKVGMVYSDILGPVWDYSCDYFKAGNRRNKR